jgi:hypothetical protein
VKIKIDELRTIVKFLSQISANYKFPAPFSYQVAKLNKEILENLEEVQRIYEGKMAGLRILDGDKYKVVSGKEMEAQAVEDECLEMEIELKSKPLKLSSFKNVEIEPKTLQGLIPIIDCQV